MSLLDQYRRELTGAQGAVTRLRAAVGTAEGRVSTKRAQLARTRSDSQRTQYTRDLERLQTALDKAQDALRKGEDKVVKSQAKVAKEEDKARKATERQQQHRDQAQRRRDQQLDQQLSWNRTAVEELHTRVSELEDNLLDQVREDIVADPVTRQHDIFLSHAAPDVDIARELYDELTARDLDVWFDGAELKLGESLMRQLDRGIARSRCGVLLLTEQFIHGRFWGEREMTALVGSRRRVIPLVVGISFEQLEEYSPILSTFVGLDVDMHGMAEVAEQIASTLS